ncbi:MAG: DoxX family membrane protein [Candidatus Rariloculaceae bacterium]
MTPSGQIDSNIASGDSPSNAQIGFFLFRVTIGVNMFFHGFMRPFTGLSAWEQPLAATFVDTYLPMPLVHTVLYSLPFYEMVLGVLLVLGLFTRAAAIGGAVMMLGLLYGNTAKQDWATVGNNMHYTLYFAGMLALQRFDWLALDNRRAATES